MSDGPNEDPNKKKSEPGTAPAASNGGSVPKVDATAKDAVRASGPGQTSDVDPIAPVIVPPLGPDVLVALLGGAVVTLQPVRPAEPSKPVADLRAGVIKTRDEALAAASKVDGTENEIARLKDSYVDDAAKKKISDLEARLEKEKEELKEKIEALAAQKNAVDALKAKAEKGSADEVRLIAYAHELERASIFLDIFKAKQELRKEAGIATDYFTDSGSRVLIGAEQNITSIQKAFADMAKAGTTTDGARAAQSLYWADTSFVALERYLERSKAIVEAGERYERKLTALAAKLEKLPASLDQEKSDDKTYKPDIAATRWTKEFIDEASKVSEAVPKWRTRYDTAVTFKDEDAPAIKTRVDEVRALQSGFDKEMAPELKKADELGIALGKARLSGDPDKIRAAEEAIEKFRTACDEKWKKLPPADVEYRQRLITASVTHGEARAASRSPDLVLDQLEKANEKGLKLVDLLAVKRLSADDLAALRKRYSERNSGADFDEWVEGRLETDKEREAWALAKKGDFVAYVKFRAPLVEDKERWSFEYQMRNLRLDERLALKESNPELMTRYGEVLKDGAAVKELLARSNVGAVFTQRELEWLRGYETADETRQGLMRQLVANRLREAGSDQEIPGLDRYGGEQDWDKRADMLLRSASRNPETAAEASKELTLLALKQNDADPYYSSQTLLFFNRVSAELVSAEQAKSAAEIRPVPLDLTLKVFQFGVLESKEGGRSYDFPKEAEDELLRVTQTRLEKALDRKLTEDELKIVRDSLKEASTQWMNDASDSRGRERYSEAPIEAVLRALGGIETDRRTELAVALHDLKSVYALVQLEVRYGVPAERELAQVNDAGADDKQTKTYIERTTPKFGGSVELTKDELKEREKDIIARAEELARVRAKADADRDLKQEEVDRLEGKLKLAKEDKDKDREKELSAQLEKAKAELRALTEGASTAKSAEEALIARQSVIIAQIEKVEPGFQERLGEAVANATCVVEAECHAEAEKLRGAWRGADRIDLEKAREAFRDHAVAVHRRIGQYNYVLVVFDQMIKDESDEEAKKTLEGLRDQAKKDLAKEKEAFEAYGMRPENQRLLGADAATRELLERDNPVLVAATLSGATDVEPLLNSALVLHTSKGNAGVLLDMLASQRATPALFALIEYQYASTHPGETLEDLLLGRLPAAQGRTGSEIEKLRESDEFKVIRSKLELLRQGKSTEYFVERCLEIRAGKGTYDGEDALAIYRLAEINDPDLKRGIIKALKEKGNVIDETLKSPLETWLYWEARKTWEDRVKTRIKELEADPALRGKSSLDWVISPGNVYKRPEFNHLDRYLGAVHYNLDAQRAASSIRLECMSPQPNHAKLMELVRVPLRDGEKMSDESYLKRQKEWGAALSAADAGVAGNSCTFVEHIKWAYGAGPGRQVEALLAGDVEKATKELAYDLSVNGTREERDMRLHCRKTAVDYARARGELEALRDKEADPDKKKALQVRIDEEIAKFRLFRESEPAKSFFDEKENAVWTEDFTKIAGEARQNHPLAASYDLGRGFVEKTPEDVKALFEMIRKNKGTCVDVTDGFGARFLTPEAGAYFARVYKDTYKEDIKYLPARVYVGERDWAKYSQADKDRWLDSESTKHLQVALERGLAGDSVGFLTARTEYEFSTGATNGGETLRRLMALYQGEPDSRFEEVMERMRAGGKSFDVLIAECRRREGYSPGVLVGVGELETWFRARAEGRVERAEAIELRYLMSQDEGRYPNRALSAQPLITFLSRNGFGPDAEARIQRIRDEYAALYGHYPETLINDRMRGNIVTVHPNDYKTVSALLQGKMAEAEKEAVRRCFWLEFNADPTKIYHIVKFEELNRVVKGIAPERLAEIKKEIDKEIAERPGFDKAGIKDLDSYILKLSLPDVATSDLKTVKHLFASEGQGIPEGAVELYIQRRDALLQQLWIADQQRHIIAAKAMGFKHTALGARNNAEQARLAYGNTTVMEAIMGHTDALERQLQRAEASASKAGQVEHALEKTLREYDGTTFLTVGTGGKFKVSTDATLAANSDRAKIASLGRDSLDETVLGNYDYASQKFNQSHELFKKHVTLDGKGMTGQVMKVDKWFSDAFASNNKNIADFEKVIENCHRTERALKITRTVVLAGGAFIATAGFGAPVIWTTLVVSGIGYGSHFIEAEGYVQNGQKSRKDAYLDAARNGTEDAMWIWSGAGAGSITLGAARNLQAIKNVGWQQWRNSQWVQIVPKNGGAPLRTMLVNKAGTYGTKELSKKALEVAARRGHTVIEAGGKVVNTAVGKPILTLPGRGGLLELKQAAKAGEHAWKLLRAGAGQEGVVAPLFIPRKEEKQEERVVSKPSPRVIAYEQPEIPKVPELRRKPIDLKDPEDSENEKRKKGKRPDEEVTTPAPPLTPDQLKAMWDDLKKAAEGIKIPTIDLAALFKKPEELPPPKKEEEPPKEPIEIDLAKLVADLRESEGVKAVFAELKVFFDRLATPPAEEEKPDPPEIEEPPPAAGDLSDYLLWLKQQAEIDLLIANLKWLLSRLPPPVEEKKPEEKKPEERTPEKKADGPLDRPEQPRRVEFASYQPPVRRGEDAVLKPMGAPQSTPENRGDALTAAPERRKVEESLPRAVRFESPERDKTKADDSKERDKQKPFDPRREWAITRATQMMLSFGLDWTTEQIETLIDDHLRRLAYKKPEKTETFVSTVFLQPPPEPGKPPAPPPSFFGFPEPPAPPPPSQPPGQAPTNTREAREDVPDDAPDSSPARRGRGAKGRDKQVAESFGRFLKAVFGLGASDEADTVVIVAPTSNAQTNGAAKKDSAASARLDLAPDALGVRVHLDANPFASSRLDSLLDAAANGRGRTLVQGNAQGDAVSLSTVAFIGVKNADAGLTQSAAATIAQVQTLVSAEMSSLASVQGAGNLRADAHGVAQANLQHLAMTQSILRAAELALQRAEGIADDVKRREALTLVADQLTRAADRLSQVQSLATAASQISGVSSELSLALEEGTSVSNAIGAGKRTARFVSLVQGDSMANATSAATADAVSLESLIDSARRDQARNRGTDRAVEQQVMLNGSVLAAQTPLGVPIAELLGNVTPQQIAQLQQVPLAERHAVLQQLAGSISDARAASHVIAELIGEMSAVQLAHLRALPIAERIDAVRQLRAEHARDVAIAAGVERMVGQLEPAQIAQLQPLPVAVQIAVAQELAASAGTARKAEHALESLIGELTPQQSARLAMLAPQQRLEAAYQLVAAHAQITNLMTAVEQLVGIVEPAQIGILKSLPWQERATAVQQLVASASDVRMTESAAANLLGVLTPEQASTLHALPAPERLAAVRRVAAAHAQDVALHVAVEQLVGVVEPAQIAQLRAIPIAQRAAVLQVLAESKNDVKAVERALGELVGSVTPAQVSRLRTLPPDLRMSAARHLVAAHATESAFDRALEELTGKVETAQLARVQALPAADRGALIQHLAAEARTESAAIAAIGNLMGELNVLQTQHVAALTVGERRAIIQQLAVAHAHAVTVENAISMLVGGLEPGQSVNVSTATSGLLRLALSDALQDRGTQNPLATVVSGVVGTLTESQAAKLAEISPGVRSAVAQALSVPHLEDVRANALAALSGTVTSATARVLDLGASPQALSMQPDRRQALSAAVIQLQAASLDLRGGGFLTEPLQRAEQVLAQFGSLLSNIAPIEGRPGSAMSGTAMASEVGIYRQQVMDHARALGDVIDMESARAHKIQIGAALDDLEAARARIGHALQIPDLPGAVRAQLVTAAVEADQAISLGQLQVLHGGITAPLVERASLWGPDSDRESSRGFGGPGTSSVPAPSTIARAAAELSRSIESLMTARNLAEVRGAEVGVRAGVELLVRESERILSTSAVQSPALRGELLRVIDEARQVLQKLDELGKVHNQELRMQQILSRPSLTELRAAIAESPLSSYVQSLLNEARLQVEIREETMKSAAAAGGSFYWNDSAPPLWTSKNRRRVKVTIDPKQIRDLLDANPELLAERVFRELQSYALRQMKAEPGDYWLARVRERTMDERLLWALKRLKKHSKRLKTAKQKAARARLRRQERTDERTKIALARAGVEVAPKVEPDEEKRVSTKTPWRVKRLRELSERAAIERSFKKE